METHIDLSDPNLDVPSLELCEELDKLLREMGIELVTEKYRDTASSKLCNGYGLRNHPEIIPAPWIVTGKLI